MAPPPGELRYLPEIRSAHFERSHRPADRVLLHAGEYADLDPRSADAPAHGRPRGVTPWTAWTWAFRGRRRIVELPEPLWLRALPGTLAVGLAFRLADLVTGHRTRIVTYAMENNAPERLFRPLPPAGRRLLAAAVRSVAGVVYDRVAFASPGAAAGYRRAGVLPAGTTTRTFLELMPACACPGVPEAGTVAFLGALEARKGVPDLLAAWATLPAGHGGVLRIAGSGPCHAEVVRAAADDPTIEYLGALDRRAVHALLRSTAVLVLPSRREGRWCEQIGLPIVEGLAHGCRVVATPDTGLAPWLREHDQVVLPADFTVPQLAAALSTALAAGLGRGADHLPSIDGRIVAEDWLYAPGAADADPDDADEQVPADHATHTSEPRAGRT